LLLIPYRRLLAFCSKWFQLWLKHRFPVVSHWSLTCTVIALSYYNSCLAPSSLVCICPRSADVDVLHLTFRWLSVETVCMKYSIFRPTHVTHPRDRSQPCNPVHSLIGLRSLPCGRHLALGTRSFKEIPRVRRSQPM